MEMRKKEIRLAEVRALPQTEDEPDMIVDGYALVFEQPTVLWTDPDTGKEYKEIISRGALDGVDLSDVPFKYNHSDLIMIMARSGNRTLTLTPDDIGLRISANLAPTTVGKDLYTLIQRGDINKMSFAFYVADDEYDRSTSTRRINKFAAIGDVSAVDVPAYDQTSISARSYYEGQKAAEEIQAREKEDMDKRKRLLVRTYFSGSENRQAIPYVKTGVVDEPWDASNMRANLKTGPDVKKEYYRQAFAWVDSGMNPDNKGSYKFLHHDVSDGGVVGPAIVRGCQTGIRVLNSGVGGLMIPDADRQGVYEHLAAHLRDAKVEPDLFKNIDTLDKEDNCPCEECDGIDCENCDVCQTCPQQEECNSSDDEAELRQELRRKLLLIKTYL